MKKDFQLPEIIDYSNILYHGYKLTDEDRKAYQKLFEELKQIIAKYKEPK
jgi:hypothetical protein